MTVEDARRKIALLRKVSADNGAVPAERETASRLQKALMERYAISDQDIRDAQPTSIFRLNWSYWQELIDEFGLRLNRFGNRGSVEVGSSSVVYISLSSNQWRVEERCAGGRQTKVRDRGLDSLRAYLKEHAPRSYSFLKR
jgi:hypothetical protein